MKPCYESGLGFIFKRTFVEYHQVSAQVNGSMGAHLILEHVYNFSRYLQVIITPNSTTKTDHCIRT